MQLEKVAIDTDIWRADEDEIGPGWVLVGGK